MKKLFTVALLSLGMLLVSTAFAQGPDHVPGDVLVMLQPEADAGHITLDLAKVDGINTGLEVVREVSAPMRAWLLRFDAAGVNEAAVLRAVQQHPSVLMAQYNHYVKDRIQPNDPQYAQQWHHLNINSAAAWDISTGGVTATGDTIVVCIIESSDVSHPDLIANAWFNYGEIAGNGIDDDGNGYTDDFRGWNTPNGNDAVYSGSHGTQVAGMIGATGDNNLGVVGANWAVKMMVVNYGGVQEAQVIAAYTYPLIMRRRYNSSAGAQGAFVVSTNASWGVDNGQPANSPLWCAMYDTLGTAGILNCGATANNNVNVDVVGDLPTACGSDFMISVTATNTADQRTFSGYGLTTIDVGAPGENVRTTSIGGGYGSTSGTSFASPLTAGVIGLLYSAPCTSMMSLVHGDPAEGALYVRQKLFEGVDQVGNLPGQTVTGGRINSGTSMELIMAGCGSCPAPFGGAVSAVTGGESTYSWNATSPGPFNVRYRVVGSPDWTDILGVDENNIAVSGLDPCTAYEFQVEVLCGAEASGFSNATLLTPPLEVAPSITASGYPLACVGEVFTLTSSTSSNVEWSTGAITPTIAITESGSYTVTLSGQCGTYTSAPLEVTILDPALPVTSNVQLPGPGVATLNATGDNITWYDMGSGGSSVGTGTMWDTPFLNVTTDYWCTNTVYSAAPSSFGGRLNNTTSGAYHPNGTNYELFTANGPFVIRSVKVYATGAGAREIGLVNAAGTVTYVQGSFDIPDGESRVDLNFQVPGPGTYGLRIMTGDPQLWRDGLGSNPVYPFALGTFGSITSSTVAGANSTAYYYFFYDWEVAPIQVACESERVQVTVDLATSVEDLSGTGSRINAFPIPADRDLFIDIDGPLASEALEIAVVDNTGRRVLAKTVTNGRITLTTAFLADGVYVYRIARGGEEVTTGRFVVAHL